MSNMDHRNQIIKARDAFFESDEGKRVGDPEGLCASDLSPFLRNRLEVAFLAGWKSCELNIADFALDRAKDFIRRASE